MHLLRDPILDMKDLSSKKIKNYNKRKKFLAIGRLTKQKNFSFLIECFEEIILKNRKITPTIAGEGEEKNKLKEMINSKNLRKKYKIGWI